MSKVTRIAYSKKLNPGKHAELKEIARRLGELRAEVWRDYGSLRGVGLEQRSIRDGWLSEKRQFDTPARLWKETLRDTMFDMGAYRAAAKLRCARQSAATRAITTNRNACIAPSSSMNGRQTPICIARCASIISMVARAWTIKSFWT